MLNEERLQEILMILDKHEYTTAKYLCTTLYVSTSTIYRDLRELSRRHLVICSGGYVQRSRDNTVTLPIDYRMSFHAVEKAAIAKAALGFIQDNAVLFLDSSTTASFLVDDLRHYQGLTVLTNGFTTAIMLRQAGIRTYFTGGNVFDHSTTVNGRLAREMVREFPIDVALFSAYAVSENGTILDPSEEEAALRRNILKRAKTSILLCDKSKMGKTSLFNIAHISGIDYLITDAKISRTEAPVRKEVINV